MVQAFEYSVHDKVTLKEINRPATITDILIDCDGHMYNQLKKQP